MSGIGQVNTSGYAPGRTSLVTFDSPDFTLAQDPFWKTLQGLEITGRAATPLTNNVSYLSGIGWRLNTFHDQLEFVHEEAATDPLVVGGAPPNILGQSIKRPLQSPEYPGVPLGAQVQGDTHHVKQVKAGDDWSSSPYNLSADYTSYPPPTETEVIALDRQRLGTSNMTPDQTLIARFALPSLGGIASIGLIARIYFVGLASYPNAGPYGTGQYALSLRADGQAFLWEITQSGVWTLRRQFAWSPPHLVAKAAHMIAITSDAFLDSDGKWHGSVINITSQAAQGFAEVVLAIQAGLAISGNTTQYVVPQNGHVQNITFVPPRADVRRTVRMKFNVSFTKFVASGVLQSQTWMVPRTLGAVGGIDPPFNVTVTGAVPAGTSIALAMFGKDGTACAAGSGPSGSSLTQTWASFARINGQQEYYLSATLNASGDGSKSPYLDIESFVRAGALAAGASTPFTVPPQSLQDYSIMGPGMDPTTETASIGLVSQQDGFTVAQQGVVDPLAALNTRSGHSVRVEVLGLPANAQGNTTSTVFLGKNARINRFRKGVRRFSPMMQPGAPQAQYPSRTWWFGKLICNGLWKRLWQAKTTQTWNFGVKDPATGNIYTITKICTILLSNSGLPNQMLDITEIPISLQADPSDKNRAFQIEVFSEALAWVLQLAREYLGAAIIIDANATNGGLTSDKYGCVRLKLPPRPAADGSYLPLAQFVDDINQTDGVLRAKMNLGSYAPFTRGDGQQVPSCPVLQGTIQLWDEPPEGNCVLVTGGIAQGDGMLRQTSGSANLWAVIHNWPAAVFFDGQPIATNTSHVDYTDGSPNLIVIIDPSLNTQGAVNFAARRVFDLSCHRRSYMRFEGPLVLVTDPLDTLQIRARPLRWGDCVIYNGAYWFVSQVTIDMEAPRGGTRNSSAIYELFQIPELQGIPSDPNASVYQSFSLYGPVASDRT